MDARLIVLVDLGKPDVFRYLPAHAGPGYNRGIFTQLPRPFNAGLL